MKAISFLIALTTILLVAGCEGPDVYPISGETCGPDDPVKTLDASDCFPPG